MPGEMVRHVPIIGRDSVLTHADARRWTSRERVHYISQDPGQQARWILKGRGRRSICFSRPQAGSQLQTTDSV